MTELNIPAALAKRVPVLGERGGSDYRFLGGGCSADINDMTEQEAMDAATRAIWNNMPKAVQAEVEADMSSQERDAVKAAIDRAKRKR